MKALGGGLHTTPASGPSRARPAASFRLIERALLISSLLAILTALGLTAWLLQRTLNSEHTPASTLGQVFERNLVTTRVVIGIILIVGWPAILHAAASLLKIRFQRPTRFLTLVAVLLGGLMYALSFLPGPAGATSFLVPLVMAPLLFRNVLHLAWGQMVRLWAVQMVALVGLMAIALWGVESIATRSPLNPVQELPIIYRLAGRPALQAQQVLPASHGGSFPPFHWSSSGSIWLDRRANQAQVEAINPGREKDWGISLYVSGDKNPIDRTRRGSNPWRSIRFIPKPEIAYSVSSDSELLPGDLIRVHSLLPMAAP